jgi:hypothetical protein
MMASRNLLIGAALAGLGFVVVHGQAELPSSWRQLPPFPRRDSEIVQCALQGAATAWQVRFNGQMLAADAIERLGAQRDPAPYELDWTHALDEQPAPPANVAPSGYQEQWATRYAREHAGRIVVRVDDGWLIGFAAGEYGGSLWWYPLQRGVGRKLWSKNVLAILPTPEAGTFMILSGLAHMGATEGAAIWIDRDEGRQWQVRKTIALGSDPSAHAVTEQGVIIAGRQIVEFLTWSGAVRALSKTAVPANTWSVAVGPAGTIAVGRTLVVGLLRPLPDGSFREELFVPDECQRLAYENNFMCICAGKAGK